MNGYYYMKRLVFRKPILRREPHLARTVFNTILQKLKNIKFLHFHCLLVTKTSYRLTIFFLHFQSCCKTNSLYYYNRLLLHIVARQP